MRTLGGRRSNSSRTKVGSCTELVSEELLYALEELSGLAVTKLFAADELLELALLRSCGTFNEFSKAELTICSLLHMDSMSSSLDGVNDKNFLPLSSNLSSNMTKGDFT